MHASHSWCVCPHSIAQARVTPLMFAAWNKSAQAPALVELLLKAEADVNAADKVSAWEGAWSGVPYVYALTGSWIMVGGFRVWLG